jgi:hypothetical protein
VWIQVCLNYGCEDESKAKKGTKFYMEMQGKTLQIFIMEQLNHAEQASSG